MDASSLLGSLVLALRAVEDGSAPEELTSQLVALLRRLVASPVGDQLPTEELPTQPPQEPGSKKSTTKKPATKKPTTSEPTTKEPPAKKPPAKKPPAKKPPRADPLLDVGAWRPIPHRQPPHPTPATRRRPRPVR
jgi:hypothetical protein